jgi:hypothetical protein
MTKTKNNFFGQWPETTAAVICNGTPHEIFISSILSSAGTQQIERMGIMIYKRGLQPTVTLQVKAYRNSVLIGTSDLWTMSEIENLHSDSGTGNFRGWMRFKFSPRLNLSAVDHTRFVLELGNYSYVEGTQWIGCILDWPTTMGYNANPTTVSSAPVALELYGYKANR